MRRAAWLGAGRINGDAVGVASVKALGEGRGEKAQESAHLVMGLAKTSSRLATFEPEQGTSALLYGSMGLFQLEE